MSNARIQPVASIGTHLQERYLIRIGTSRLHRMSAQQNLNSNREVHSNHKENSKEILQQIARFNAVFSLRPRATATAKDLQVVNTRRTIATCTFSALTNSEHQPHTGTLVRSSPEPYARLLVAGAFMFQPQFHPPTQSLRGASEEFVIMAGIFTK